MSWLRRIVVGTDFSDGAEHALRMAVNLAAGTGAVVTLVHAFEQSLSDGRTCEDLAAEARGRLAASVERSGAAQVGVAIELVTRRGAPSEKLLNLATDIGADLVVVGACGSRGVQTGLPLGSVAMRIAATSKRSIAIVHPPPATLASTRLEQNKN